MNFYYLFCLSQSLIIERDSPLTKQTTNLLVTFLIPKNCFTRSKVGCSPGSIWITGISLGVLRVQNVRRNDSCSLSATSAPWYRFTISWARKSFHFIGPSPPDRYLCHILQWHIRVDLQVADNEMIRQRHQRPQPSRGLCPDPYCSPDFALFRFTIDSWRNLCCNNDLGDCPSRSDRSAHHLIEELISANDGQI